MAYQIDYTVERWQKRTLFPFFFVFPKECRIGLQPLDPIRQELQKNLMRLLLILLCVSFVCTSSAFAQWRKKVPKNKLGAIYATVVGTTYELTNRTPDNVNSGKSESGSSQIVGAVFFYERIFLGRFSAGIEATSFLERQMELKVGTEVVDVVEKSKMIALDFKAFYRDHAIRGVKPYLKVGFGTLKMESDLKMAAAGTSTSTSADIPITLLALGFDYILEAGGFRFEVGSVTGERKDLGDEKFTAEYQAHGTTASIGVQILY